MEIQLPHMTQADIDAIDPKLWEVPLVEIRVRIGLAKMIFDMLSKEDPADPLLPGLWEKYKKEAAILCYVEAEKVAKGEDTPAPPPDPNRPPDIVTGLKTLELKATRG